MKVVNEKGPHRGPFPSGAMWHCPDCPMLAKAVGDAASFGFRTTGPALAAIHAPNFRFFSVGCHLRFSGPS